MNNEELAKKILSQVGGKENVQNATHCATRLRLNVQNEELVDLTSLEKLPDVIRAQFSNGQLQIVLGGKVTGVYGAFSTLLPESNDVSGETEKKKLSFGLFIETIAGIFSPTLPILIGCGMVQSVNAILTNFQLISPESDVIKLLQMTGDLIFYFLPFFLAVSAAKKFKTNEYMAIALAAAYMYPTIQNGALQAAETGIQALDFFGLPLLFVNYKSTVFPIIIAVWVMSYVYKWIEKIMPDMLKILLVPLLTLFIMIPLQLGVLGPIGSYLGIYIAQGVNWLYNTGGLVGAFLLGALRPVLVMFGMHYAITPIMVQEVAETGKTVIIPALLAGNLAQAGAAFAVGFKLKNKVEKTGAFTAATTAFLGITEPAMYGYNLKYKKPFYAALLSAGVAAAYLSIFHAYSTAVALPGILAISTYSATSFIHILIGVSIALVGGFVLTMILGLDGKVNQTVDEMEQEESIVSEVQEILLPIKGEKIDLSEVPDEMFSQKLLGDGFAIRPTEGKVYAPFNGTVEMIFDTYHAIGLKSDTGTELLIHIGIDTVNLKKQGFVPKVQAGDTIKVGDLLMEFDIDQIKKSGYSIETPIVVTNGREFRIVE
ncbi:PTS glucose transporter subunit IIA [Enterococcus saccharolyticus]|uniref:beta-glucoside-specific PTS transporter subunit IIABC n=2 Tax=Enterococcus TaxID=1350 RepID=UPI001E4B3741|nr:beta-glucoside-specific PTS transporter subunit IIABC [Enterococcus saccharolyticus]MCD5002386.1 PTS glucose transporter subunit IIA [Enterococcus saccharolyticus]